jgi:hypothetical protein
MKMVVVCFVVPCSLVEVYGRFRDVCCLLHQDDESSTSETPVNFYQTTRYNNGNTAILYCLHVFASGGNTCQLEELLIKISKFSA